MGVEVTVRENDAIRKIKKLMKLADPSRGASDGEIENALRMIDRLMRENNLSMAEVKVEDEDAALKSCEGEGHHHDNCAGGVILTPETCKDRRNHPFTCGCSVPIV